MADGVGRRLAAWAPALVAVLLCASILARYDVPWGATGLYTLWFVVAVTLPGTLLWRMLRGRVGALLEDAAIGTALGLAVQAVLAYAMSPFGAMQWSALWVPAVLVASAASPRGRAAWHRSDAPALRPWHAWALAASPVLATLWLAGTAFRTNEVVVTADGAVPLAPYVDMTFHQSLAAGIDDAWPLVHPYVPDVVLRYQLAVYEHLSAAAHLTGVDLTWVVMRLAVVPLVATALVLVGILARRLADHDVALPLGALVALLSAPLSPYGWSTRAFGDLGTLNLGTYRSPTQTFGEPLFLALVILLVELLRGREREPRRWGTLVAFAVLALAAGGAKATFLPLLTCGLLLALVVALVLRRARVLTAGLLGLVVLAWVVATATVTGFGTRGLAVGPFQLARLSGVFSGTGLEPEGTTLVVVVALCAVAWVAAGVGAALLLRARPRDLGVWVAVGVVLGGLGGAMLASQTGLSQAYFLRSTWPVLAVLAVAGVVVAARERPDVPVAWTAGAGAAGGALVVVVTRAVTARTPDLDDAQWFVGLLWPWAGLVLVVVLGSAVLLVVRRQAGTAVAVLVCAVLLGASLPTVAREIGGEVEDVGSPVRYEAEGAVLGPDLVRAAAFLREASAEGDLVATNVHCQPLEGPCDARHFVVSALSERRVLVEGWAYAVPEFADPMDHTVLSPYWDAEQLALNDAVVSDPTGSAARELTDRYGVSWYVVDRTVEREVPELQRAATLELDLPGAAVYRLDGGAR